MDYKIDTNEKVIPDAPTGISQNAEDIQEVNLVKSLYEQGKKARGKYDGDWSTRWDFYKGKQWDKGIPAYRAKPVMNVIRTIIQGTLPILTDARPGFNVLPREPSDYQFSQLLGDATSSWWDKPEVMMDIRLLEVLMDAMVTDYGVLKVYWDSEAEEGAGDIAVKVVNPNKIYVSADTIDFDVNCPWVIEEDYRCVGELKRMFPDKADKIKGDDNKDEKSEDATSINTEVKIISPTDKHVGNVDGASPSSGSDSRKLCRVFECWISDDTIIEYEEENDQGEKSKAYKKKFPRGKKITILPNQQLLLDSDENPYRHGRWPYIRFIDSILPRSFHGEGEAESLIDISRAINKILGIILDYSNFMGNPVWVVEKNSGVNPASITNQCGLVLQPNEGKGNAVRREIPPALPPYFLELYQLFVKMSEQISGITEVSQGRQPTGVTAAAAIDSLQQASQTRIRLKERNMQVSLGKMGFQVTALMMQYYKTPRIARISGKSDAWPDYFEYYFTDTPDGKYQATKYNYQYDQNSEGYVKSEIPQQTAPSKGVFDIKIMSGTAMPFAKSQRINTAFKLFESGVLTPEGLLKAVEWPDYEQELKKIEEMKMAQAQQQPAPQPQ